jgi:hypothetical protein
MHHAWRKKKLGSFNSEKKIKILKDFNFIEKIPINAFELNDPIL